MIKIGGIDPSINSTGICVLTLDEDFNIIDGKPTGFIQVKKNVTDYTHYYKKKDFNHIIEQYLWMYEHILEAVSDCAYVALEDYSYGSKGRSVFQIGEYVGGLKTRLFEAGLQLRMYEPTVVKMFATGKGNCDKIAMCDKFDEDKEDIIDLTKLPNHKQPKEDIVDAYYTSKLLYTELTLRYGIKLLKEMNEETIKIFNRVTKVNPENILTRDFIQKQL